MKPGIAYQLYSAREDTANDLPGTLAELLAMGYEGVELDDFYGRSAEELRALIAESGLALVCSHVTLAQIEKGGDELIAFHREMGCPTIALAYLEPPYRPGKPGFAGVLNALYDFGERCADQGVRLVYHNHDFEFAQVSGMSGLDFLYRCAPASLLAAEPDVCWIRYAGVDPAAFIRRYAGRVPLIHLKDYHGRFEDGDFRFTPVGQGCMDVATVMRAGMESGAEWFIVEQDESLERPALEAAAISLRTVQQLRGEIML